MMVSSEEAARLRLNLLKKKALRHLRNAAYLLGKMKIEARSLSMDPHREKVERH